MKKYESRLRPNCLRSHCTSCWRSTAGCIWNFGTRTPCRRHSTVRRHAVFLSHI